MVHYVYKITNLKNGMFYIGKHSSNKIDDDYMGSGKLIQRAIAKHGIENFKKEILKHFESAEEALEYERSLVTPAIVERKDTYNLTMGGHGSWHHINSNDELQKSAASKAAKVMNIKKWLNADYVERHRLRSIERFKQLHAIGVLKPPSFEGRKHTLDSKQRIGNANSKHQTGTGNSNFGNVWIHSLSEKRSMRIPKEDLDTWISYGWIKGRKMKFE